MDKLPGRTLIAALKISPQKSRGPVSDFVFATCREGSERPLKKYVAARSGTLLRPAFMRPQLITFKSAKLLDGAFALDTPFARLTGISLGMFASDEELVQKTHEAFGDRPLRLHVFPRETPENGVTPETWSKVDARHDALAAAMRAAGCVVHDVAQPQDGDHVLDVIVGSEGERTLLGTHIHSARCQSLPGGLSRLVLREDAPSRAWLKMEQALIFAKLDGPKALPGKTAVELGSAPGGAALALLDRGVNVIGVDTADMDPRITHYKKPGGGRFTYLRMSAMDVLDEDLPRPVHLLISDMNVAPPVMIGMIERLQAQLNARVLILTLKINDPTMEWSLPKFLTRIRRFAPSPVRAVQLPANREEICVVAGELVHGRIGRVARSSDAARFDGDE